MAISTILAEFKAKDSATSTVKKVEQELRKTRKATEESEKGLKRFENQAKKAGGAWARFRSAVAGVKGKIGGADKLTAGAISGGAGGFLTGVAGVFGIGGVASAMIGAMQEMSSEFVSGAQVLKEQRLSLANYNIALSRNAEALKTAFSKNRFIRRDLEIGLTAVADLGVTSDTLKKYAKEIEAFADAQGYESITEALQALTSGTVKAGRGLDAAQAELLKSYSTLLQNQFTADAGMQLIGDLLKRNYDAMKITSSKFSKIAKSAVQTANIIEQREEDFVAAAVTEKAMQAYTTSFAAREQLRSLKQIAGAGAAQAITKIQSVLPKRQKGGHVGAGQAYLVGEKGAEIFVPKQSGEILPITAKRKTKVEKSEEKAIVINMYNNVKISTNENTTEAAIVKAIESAARKIYKPLISAAKR